MTDETRHVAVTPLTGDDAAAGVLPRFRRVLEQVPQASAVVDEVDAWTFARLAQEAAAVRAAVATADASPVAILFPHRVQAVAAVLGVLASGRPLLVLDQRTPAPRLRELCERVGAGVVLAGEGQLAPAGELGRPVVDATALPAAAPESLFATMPDPAAPAILAFTSGSTGTPKVVLNNGHMLTADAWRNSHATGCYGPDDVIAHTLPMAFHAGLMVTVAGLLVGSTMRLYDTRSRGIGELASWIEQVGATVMHTSPAILRALVSSSPDPAMLRGLTSVTIAGEPAHGRDVESLRALLPTSCIVRNRYGSSETGLIAEHRIPGSAPRLEGALPVGEPVGHTDITIVDEAGTPLPQGEVGTVVVTRDHVASGYLDNPEATAASFRTEPDGRRTYVTSDLGTLTDGVLRLVGRRDHSVKIRGYMAEPGEVDAALFARTDVVEALTVGDRVADEDRYRLVSYVVSSADRPAAAEIRADLRRRLPAHLVPESVVFLDALPRTERGKLDRSALPPAPDVDMGEPPASDWEAIVAQAWTLVLGVPDIGRDADFFALGGDSLAAEELSARVVKDLGVDPTRAAASTLVEAPTLAQYALALRRTPDRRRQIISILREPEGTTQRPLFLVAGGGGLGVGFVQVVDHLPADLPVYAFQAHGLERRAVPDWSVPAAARRNLKMLKEIQPAGPYRLGGHSFGGLVALEMAQQLRRTGEEVEILIELDSFPPEPSIIPPLPEEGHTLSERLRRLASLSITGIIPTPGASQFWRFHMQSHYLSKTYRTEPYPGRTLVVVADSDDVIARSAWEPHLTGEWRRVSTPGSHMSMLREPHAAHVAAHIADALGCTAVADS